LSDCRVIVMKYAAFGLPGWKPVITKTFKRRVRHVGISRR
jgi:hypothetical protein